MENEKKRLLYDTVSKKALENLLKQIGTSNFDESPSVSLMTLVCLMTEFAIYSFETIHSVPQEEVLKIFTELLNSQILRRRKGTKV